MSNNAYSIMPWESEPGQEKKLLSGVLIAMVIVLLFAVLVSNIELPPAEKEQIPERFAQLIIAKQQPKIKPPVVEKAQPEAEPEPQKQDEPEKKPQPAAEQKKRPPLPAADERTQKAREVAAQTGILKNVAALESLQSMGLGDSFSAESLPMISSAQSKRKVYVGADFEVDLAAKGGAIDTDKYLVADKVGVDLGERQTAAIKGKKIQATAKNMPSSSAPKSHGRSNQQIYLANQRIKGSLDRIYNRARRTNPSLQGVIKFKISINSAGKVSAASIISSSINDSALEKQLLDRIKLMANYGAGIAETIQFSISFTP